MLVLFVVEHGAAERHEDQSAEDGVGGHAVEARGPRHVVWQGREHGGELARLPRAQDAEACRLAPPLARDEVVGCEQLRLTKLDGELRRKKRRCSTSMRTFPAYLYASCWSCTHSVSVRIRSAIIKLSIRNNMPGTRDGTAVTMGPMIWAYFTRSAASGTQPDSSCKEMKLSGGRCVPQ